MRDDKLCLVLTSYLISLGGWDFNNCLSNSGTYFILADKTGRRANDPQSLSIFFLPLLPPIDYNSWVLVVSLSSLQRLIILLVKSSQTNRGFLCCPNVHFFVPLKPPEEDGSTFVFLYGKKKIFLGIVFLLISEFPKFHFRWNQLNAIIFVGGLSA